MVKYLCMALVYYLQERWQYNSHVDFQLGVKLDSISLPDVYTESSECQSSLCNSGSALIINVHCSGESALQVRRFINNLDFVHSL